MCLLFELNARASNSVKSWIWHFIAALLLRQLITAIVANNFPESLKVEQRHGFEPHLSVRVVVQIVGRKQKVFLLAKLVEVWRPLTRHSGAAEGLIAPSPFRCRFGKGGKLRLIVERAR